MSDDERLKRIATDVVRFEPTTEGAKTLADAVLRLLAERDKLAAELAILKKGEPTDAELMAAAVDAQRRADNYAKKLGELDTELAELRAACEPFAKWWQEAVDNTAPSALENAARRPIAYDGLHHGPTLGDCRRIADMLARTPEATR